MKPVFQDQFGKPDGNCFAACIASILEIPLRSVPAEFHGTRTWETDSNAFFEALNAWLAPQGLVMLVITCPDPDKHLPNVWLIIGGTAARGIEHCVVGRGSKTMHDPHPDGTGLTSVDCFYAFIAMDSKEVRRHYKRIDKQARRLYPDRRVGGRGKGV